MTSKFDDFFQQYIGKDDQRRFTVEAYFDWCGLYGAPLKKTLRKQFRNVFEFTDKPCQPGLISNPPTGMQARAPCVWRSQKFNFRK